MRCVPAAPAALQGLPDLESLEGVRHLPSRFPAARVREVAVVRATDLEPVADPAGSTRVWLALEALQVTGNVKVRGALVSVHAHRALGHVVAASTGNHGAAVAYAAAVLGVGATVIVPRGMARAKVDAIARYGAEVVVAPSARYEDLEKSGRELAASRGAAFVSAHDDLHTALGNGASLGFEIVRALGRVPDRVIVPAGRNGLATGITWSFAADAPGAPGAPARVWSAACDGARAALPAPAEPGPAAGTVLVPETYISLAVAHAHRHVGILLEESAAAPLAPVLAGLPEPLRGGDLVVVLAGREKNPRRIEALLGSPVDDGAI